MELEWDEEKRSEVWRRRGVDLLRAALIFEDRVLTRVDTRHEYGEVRHISLGLVEGEPYVVVHTERDGVTRLITAWKGGRSELQYYQASIARRPPEDEG